MQLIIRADKSPPKCFREYEQLMSSAPVDLFLALMIEVRK